MTKRKRPIDDKSGTIKAAIDKDIIRQLRTKIMVSDLNPKVISITSSVSGEGKTTIALNLADALVATGKKAIFVDGSLRKVSLAKKSETYATLGLSTLLEGAYESNNNEFILRQTTGGADLIINLRPSENSTELLESLKFSQLVGKLRAEYDYVILDTPDMSSCSDAVVISNLADAIIHVVEANKVFGDKVGSDIRFLEETKTPVIGIILNKIEHHI